MHSKHVERIHNQRADAIITAADRLGEVCDNKGDRQSIRDEVDRQEAERLAAKSKLYHQEHDRVNRARANKASREAVNSFVAQQSSLAKTCNSIDLWKARLHNKAAAAQRAEEEKQQRAASTARHATQRALQEAQQRKVDGQMQRKQKYLIKISRDAVRNEAQQIRDRVGAELDLKRLFQKQQTELANITNGHMTDVCSYERTLAALRDLAAGIKEGQTLQAIADVADHKDEEEAQRYTPDCPVEVEPLVDTEPRVLAALAGGGLGKPSPVDLYLGAAGVPGPLQHSQTAMESDIEWMVPPGRDEDETPWPMPCAPRLPSAREASTPRSAARASSRRNAPSPLLVRPLVDLRQQVGQTATQMRPHTSPAQPPNKGKLRPDSVESLRALRMIRRTGPIVKR